MSLFVFDLDGTLADCAHRAHFINRVNEEHTDWELFHAEAHRDVLIEPVRAILYALIKTGSAVEIWTGRSENYRRQSEEWLTLNDIPSELLTFMRAKNDRRPDTVVKREFLGRSAMRPAAIFEDRARVVAMWRAEGIPCLQVAEGDF
jgi:FMN phosphatase YigB (HAD superfamily)